MSAELALAIVATIDLCLKFVRSSPMIYGPGLIVFDLPGTETKRRTHTLPLGAPMMSSQELCFNLKMGC